MFMILPCLRSLICFAASCDEYSTPFQVRGNLLLDLFRRELHKRLGDKDAGIVHQHIDLAVLGDRLLEDLLRRFGPADIARDAEEAFARVQLRGSGLQAFGGTARADDVVTLFEESLGQAQADAAGGAGDDDGVA